MDHLAGYIDLGREVPDLARLTVEPGEELGDGVWAYDPYADPQEWMLQGIEQISSDLHVPLADIDIFRLDLPQVTTELQNDVRDQLEAMTELNMDWEPSMSPVSFPNVSTPTGPSAQDNGTAPMELDDTTHVRRPRLAGFRLVQAH